MGEPYDQLDDDLRAVVLAAAAFDSGMVKRRDADPQIDAALTAAIQRIAALVGLNYNTTNAN